MVSTQRYTDKQKIAYYKKKASYCTGRPARRAPRRKYVKGQGSYRIPRDFFSARKVGSSLGGAAGAMLGNMVAPGIGSQMGEQLGSSVGGRLGDYFKSITGWGDYAVKSNSVLFPEQIVPSFGEDTIRVRKREFICNIPASTAFNLSSFKINPGLSESFPWLSQISNNYEQYRFNGLVFQLVSTCSDAIASSTNLSLGVVCLATDYNAVDGDFNNMAQMLGSMFSNSAKPSENIMHAIECAPTDQAQKLYYVRSGAAPANSDLRLYDLGNFQVATEGMQAVYSQMSQLWVSYDVTFCKSVQNNQMGSNLNTDMFSLITGTTNANIFGNGTQTYGDEGSNLGCYINNTNIYFPEGLEAGYFQVTFRCTGGSAAITMPGVSTINCGTVWAWSDGADAGAEAAGTMTTFVFSLIIKLETITSTAYNGAYIGFSAGVYPTSVTKASLLISQVNGDIYENRVVT